MTVSKLLMIVFILAHILILLYEKSTSIDVISTTEFVVSFFIFVPLYAFFVGREMSSGKNKRTQTVVITGLVSIILPGIFYLSALKPQIKTVSFCNTEAKYVTKRVFLNDNAPPPGSCIEAESRTAGLPVIYSSTRYYVNGELIAKERPRYISWQYITSVMIVALLLGSVIYFIRNSKKKM